MVAWQLYEVGGKRYADDREAVWGGKNVFHDYTGWLVKNVPNFAMMLYYSTLEFKQKAESLGFFMIYPVIRGFQ